MRLPCKPCRAGWQPVAIEAAETRVTDGKTARCSAHHRLLPGQRMQHRRALRRHPIDTEAIAADENRDLCHQNGHQLFFLSSLLVSLPAIGTGGGNSTSRQPPPSAVTRLALAVSRVSRTLSRVSSAHSAAVWV